MLITHLTSLSRTCWGSVGSLRLAFESKIVVEDTSVCVMAVEYKFMGTGSTDVADVRLARLRFPLH